MRCTTTASSSRSVHARSVSGRRRGCSPIAVPAMRTSIGACFASLKTAASAGWRSSSRTERAGRSPCTSWRSRPRLRAARAGSRLSCASSRPKSRPWRGSGRPPARPSVWFSTNPACGCTSTARECRADRDGYTSRRATAASVSTALSLCRGWWDRSCEVSPSIRRLHPHRRRRPRPRDARRVRRG
jgi:hypothetical protein